MTRSAPSAAVPRAEDAVVIDLDRPLCSVTRLEFPSLHSYIRFLSKYVFIRRKARRVPGMEGVALVQHGDRVVTIISLWRNFHSIAWFGTDVPQHVFAVNWVLQLPEARTWSGIYQLMGDTAPSDRALIWNEKQ